MQITYAKIKEQNVTFAIVSVKDHVVQCSQTSKQLIAQLMPLFGCPVALLGESNGRLYGRDDIVRFMGSVHPSQIPWAVQVDPVVSISDAT